ncbi:hypothetical protein [Ligilactobacillus ruminis]|nr:hypothetical protein [Ligilactobacillus ruminis]
MRADLASTAFGKITAVYGHIDENGHFVRKSELNLADLIEQHCI